jgi:hypothetical protein
MSEFVSIAKEYGPWAAMIAFFIWRDYRREQSMGTLLTSLNLFIRDTLMKTVEESTAAMNRQTESNRELISAIKADGDRK